MVKGRFIRDGYTGQTAPAFCPLCFHLLDGVTNMTGREAPQPGDFTVCIYCANVLRFTDKMGLQLSALIEAPVEIRFELVKVVNAVKCRIATEGK